MAAALEGITILDLTRVLAGPYCTMILGDLGANVIKVESITSGDDTRAWGPPFTGGESAYYLCANRNKRAITLNLKSESGQEVLYKLIAKSDVVVQNFKAGTLDKIGFGYDRMKEINPQIISASITGFGLTGPYKEDAGYDYIIQAMSGLMSITGNPDGEPTKLGVAIADILTGLYTAIGILAAMQDRNRTGEGQQIDISLFDSQLSALVNVASNYLVSGKIPKRMGNQHPNIVPYQVFPTGDQDLVVAVGNDRQFAKLCTVLGIPEAALDERYKTNTKRLEYRNELIGLLSQEFRKKPSAEWHQLLKKAGIPNGPINDMEKVFENPQVHARDMLVEMNHPTAGKIKLVGSPLKLSRSSVKMRRHPPLYSEHTREVLMELGFTDEQIAEMKSNKII